MKLFLSKYSLYTTLSLIIVSIVTLLIFIHSAGLYHETKNKLYQQLKTNSGLKINSLQKNISKHIDAYEINQYQLLAQNEMGHNEIFAIIVEDYNMGKILGEGVYISGKIRDNNWKILDFDPLNKQQLDQLAKSFYIEKKDIFNSTEVKIGSLTLHLSDNFIHKELNHLITSNAIQAVVMAIILLVFLFATIRFFVLKPIANIIQTIKDTEENGIPTQTIPMRGSREIILFSKTINKMIESIKQSHLVLKKQHQQLERQAHYDALTNLPNRILFLDRLNHSIEKSKRYQMKTALFFIDLDRFKEINDSLGHETGDEILVIVAQRLQSIIRDEDTLARLGGDEFTIIIDALSQAQDASQLASKIISTLIKPIQYRDNTLFISSSIGISLYPDDGITSQELLKYSDAAMYKAKDKGRNNFQFYSSEMTESALEKVLMEASLRQALVDQEFVVYYQPQINGLSDKLTGMEALVRWQHNIESPQQSSLSKTELIPPYKFIPLAESTGLIIQLDQFVMKTAMQQFSAWHQQGLNPGKLSLNLAMQQLQQENFVSILIDLINQTGCQAEWLEFEVTETQIMSDPSLAIKTLTKMNKIGINISVDDFGTGYSSLAYLKKLPINKLKIDKAFVDELPHDEDDVAISKSIIALGHNLGLTLIAEGVETEEQKNFLVDNGCENIQGYLYSKPLPTNEMTQFLTNSQTSDD